MVMDPAYLASLPSGPDGVRTKEFLRQGVAVRCISATATGAVINGQATYQDGSPIAEEVVCVARGTAALGVLIEVSTGTLLSQGYCEAVFKTNASGAFSLTTTSMTPSVSVSLFARGGEAAILVNVVPIPGDGGGSGGGGGGGEGPALSSATPQPIAAAGAAGVAVTASRSDHVHAHGDQLGGTLHAVASGAGAGFMSAADKTKLDGIEEGATAGGGGADLSDAAPQALGTAAAGTSVEASRADHVHAHGNLAGGALHADVVAGGASGFMTGADKTKLDGVATGADVSPALASTAPEPLGVAAVGTGNTTARADHVHAHGNLAGGSLHAVAVSGGAAGFMSGTDKAALDDLVANGSGPELADTNPAAIGATSAGASTEASRSDHVHAHGNQLGGSLHAVAGVDAGFMSAADKAKLDGIEEGATAGGGGADVTDTAPADVTKAAAEVGVSVEAARADHKHDVATATPSAIGTANSEGTSSSLARADHIHSHGDQAGGSLHADVTAGGASGFMTGADKTKLDGVAAGATNLALASTTPEALGTAAVGIGTTAARADHVHEHGNLAGGSLHAVAVASGAAGFLSGTDKAKLDGIASGATVAPSLASTTPAAVAAVGAVGVGTTTARADHVHAHGDLAGGSLHALVGIAAGFMSPADKTKLDGIEEGATAGGTPGADGDPGLGFVSGDKQVVRVACGIRESHDSTTPLVVSTFSFLPGDHTVAGMTMTARLEVVSAKGDSVNGTVRLYNLTDGEVCGAAISFTSTTPTKQTAALTIGTAAGDLKTTEKLYELQAYLAGAGGDNDSVELYSAYLIITNTVP